MSWKDRIKVWILILATVAVCAYIAKPTAAAQRYPEAFSNFQKQMTYFWDSRTNLCFAYFEIDNGYGTPSLGFTITNVPCTEEVKNLIDRGRK